MLNVVATAAASCELSSGGEESTSRANLTNSVHAFSSRLKKNYKLQSANNFIQQQQQHIQTKNLPVLNSASHPSSGKNYVFLLLLNCSVFFACSCSCLCFICK